MKKRDLIKLFEKNGWWLERHGSKHDVYTNGVQTEMLPRHAEVNERTAQKIISRAGLKLK